MFYEPRLADHGLPHDPFKAIIAPRPIGWISSIGTSGAINLAPYSFFNAISSRPPVVLFASEERKDSLTFIEETGTFVCNLVTMELAHAMNQSSAALPRGASEFAFAELELEPSRLVAAPRVRGAAAALECRHIGTQRVVDADGRATSSWLVQGEVVGVHLEDRFVIDGIVQTAAMQPVARCGYDQYAVVERVFSLKRPVVG